MDLPEVHFCGDDDGPESKSCRAMKLVGLIEENKSTDSKDLNAFAKKARILFKDNNISERDMTPENLLTIYESFKIDPNYSEITNFLNEVLTRDFLIELTENPNIEEMHVDKIKKEAGKLFDNLKKIRPANKQAVVSKTLPKKPAWRGGKKKTIRKKSKKSKKTMKRNKKRFSYKIYGGEPISVGILIVICTVTLLAGAIAGYIENKIFSQNSNPLPNNYE
jgi:hypothetical protein